MEYRSIAVEKLLKGQESAARLRTLIHHALLGNHVLDPAAGNLIDEVLGFFSASDGGESSPVAKQAQVDTELTSVGNSAQKRKISPVGRDRRGGGGRRRGNPYSWRQITAETIHDGHTWRKYGQKEIFSAKYPRSYFRCTHKFDQGCHATRQVQQSEEDPSLFQITYIGEHTCKDGTKSSQLSATSHHREACVISFGSNTVDKKEPTPFPSFQFSKHDSDEDVLSSLTPRSSSSDQFSASTVMPDFGMFVPPMEQIVAAMSDNGDTNSLQSSTSNLDIGFEGFDLEDIFSFDQNESFKLEDFSI